jgi:gamma-glutamylcyclotransferase
MTRNIATGSKRASSITMNFYFAYGSNMNPSRVESRQMPFSGFESGVLKGYRLVFNKRSTIIPGAASANIEPAADDQVEGVIYALKDEYGIDAMDPFEGYPVRYDRTLVDIEMKQSNVQSWVYIANEAYRQSGLLPAAWYLNHLLAGEPYLSQPYFERLCRQPCLPNSDLEPRVEG